MHIDGEEWLRYKSFPLNVALIRATYCDEDGNATMEKEAATLDSLSIAQAAKNSGGIVLLQVEKGGTERYTGSKKSENTRNLCGWYRCCTPGKSLADICEPV